MQNIIKKIIHKFGYKLTSINEDIDIVEKNDYENNLIKKIKDLTLTTDQRIWLLIQSFKHLNSNNITGDFVECGVWRGGNLILLAELQTSKRKGTNIDIPNVVIKIPMKKKIILKFNIFNYNLSFQENKTVNRMGDIVLHPCLNS